MNMRGSQKKPQNLQALAPSIPAAFLNVPSVSKLAVSPSQENATKFQGHYETEFIM